MSSYRIADEPRPGALANVAVSPLWPFLAVMFGGVGIAWSWFALNAFAIGSATKARELALIVTGLGLSMALAAGLLMADQRNWLSPTAAPYSTLAIIACKLFVSYRLYALQAKSHQLYVYFGGRSRVGWPILFATLMLRRLNAGALGDFWILVIG